jgi:cell division protein ZipA
MTELRWVLLALGVLLILGVVLWSRGLPQRWIAPVTRLRRPRDGGSDRVEPRLQDAEAYAEPEPAPSTPAEPHSEPSAPERVVTIRFIPDSRTIASDRVILALRAAGLKHGRFGIFHSHADEFSDEPVFSVASLTEPGSFDLTRLAETRVAGTSFFMVLPGVGDPVERFDKMVAAARQIAQELEGELRDERGSSWSIQRERYIREEIIEYRHQHGSRLSD